LSQSNERRGRERTKIKRNTFLRKKSRNMGRSGNASFERSPAQKSELLERRRNMKIKSPFNGNEKVSRTSQKWSMNLRSGSNVDVGGGMVFGGGTPLSPSKFSSISKVTKKSGKSNIRLTPMNSENKNLLRRKSRSPAQRITRNRNKPSLSPLNNP
jgi:hypothetical protein